MQQVERAPFCLLLPPFEFRRFSPFSYLFVLFTLYDDGIGEMARDVFASCRLRDQIVSAVTWANREINRLTLDYVDFNLEYDLAR